MANSVVEQSSASRHVQPRGSQREGAQRNGPAAVESGLESGTFESAALPGRARLAWTAVAAVGLIGAAIAPSFFLSSSNRDPSDTDRSVEKSRDSVIDLSSEHSTKIELTPQEIAGRSIEGALTTPGWHWAMKPQEVPSDSGAVSFVRLQFKPGADLLQSIQQVPDKKWEVEDGQLLVPIQRESEGVYQLIAFNSKGERTDISVRTRDPHSFGFTVTSVPDLKWIGFQVGRPDELAKISTAAYEKATKLGLHVLPAGEIGKPFDYTLSKIDGSTVSQKDLSGKVVVMLEWATWCMSCHATMKELFPVLAKYGNDVQLVLISHDEPKRREMALEEMKGFPAGTINIGLFYDGGSSEPKVTQELWPLARKGVNSYGIPTVIVVGPDDILRMDSVSPSVKSVEAIIAKAIDDKSNKTLATQGR